MKLNKLIIQIPKKEIKNMNAYIQLCNKNGLSTNYIIINLTKYKVKNN